MRKISSSAFDKVQTSTLTALSHIFDTTTRVINEAISQNSIKFEAIEQPVNDAASNLETTEESKNKDSALEFKSAEKKLESKPESASNAALKGLNVKILDAYTQHLPTMKAAASAELRKIYTQISTLQSRKLTTTAFDTLELVSFEDMEMQIILSHFEQVLQKHFQVPLAMLSMRFEAICKTEISLNRLPVSPSILGHTLLAAVKTIDLDINDKKSLFMALLTALKNVYKALLEQTNKLFVENNVLPHLSQHDVEVQQKRIVQKQQAEENRKKLLGISGDEKNPSAQLNQFLQELHIPSSAKAHQIFTKKGAPTLPKQQLAEKINLIKKQIKHEENGVYRKFDNQHSLAEQLTQLAQLQDFGLSTRANKTISLISMTFEQLLNNDTVPDAVKALLTQLQMPLLKAAVQDDMFLMDTDNPAQKLFNRISSAGMTWSPEKSPESDQLYKKMSAIVDNVSNKFDDDYLVFDEAVAELDNFQAEEQEKTSHLENRIIDRETAQARLNKARQIAEQHIDKKFGKLQLPESIDTFLKTTWQQVLFFIYNKEHSTQANDWLDAVEIENNLLSNLSQKERDDVEAFLIALEEKLLDCGIAKNDADKQIAAIQDAFTEDYSETLADIILEEPELEEEVQLSEDDDALLENIVVGSWLQKNNVEPPVKIKVAAHIKFNDAYIMVYRNGMKENTYKRLQLIDLIRNNEMQILDSGLLFESSLESVISSIR